MRRVRLAAATVLTLLALAAPATATTEVASLGSVRAELSYTKHKQYPYATGVSLRVFDGDTPIASRTISDDMALSPIGLNGGSKSVSVRDLDKDGVGEAVFDLYSGGAHCCEITYLYDGATEIVHDWADPGYEFKDIDGDGTDEFVSADARFQYTLADSFAASYPPAQIFRLANGALQDVTKDPSVAPAVRTDARRALKTYRYARRKARKDPVYQELIKSTLGAYSADQCSLGDCAPGYARIRTAVAAGQVSKTKHYLGTVRKLLRKLGYDAA